MSQNYPELHLYINGQWCKADGGATLPVLNPADEEILGWLPAAGPEDVERAIESAHRAFQHWKCTGPTVRSDILRRVVDYIHGHRDELARIITLELGKPLPESLVEADKAAEHFQWASEETRRLYGRVIPSRDGRTNQVVTSEPIGPVAAFSGWNAPAITPSRKIAGALAAGCTLVIKPAEETPASALFLAKALEEAGLPAGVLNVVFGDPARISGQLLDSDRIKGLTFTGSSQIGKQLAQRAAGSLKRMVLELGGHAPALVFEDADPEAAALTLASAKYRNAGQICTSPTRILVHESIAQPFYASFARYVQTLKVGNGLDEGVAMGPLANPRRLDAIASMVSDALDKGGELLAGGSRIGEKGYYHQPTVIAGFNPRWTAANIEPFGPLALLGSFKTSEQALAEANRLPFGLAAYLFSHDARTIRHMSREIESGAICVNHCVHSIAETPFGGYKDSGLGKEGGVEGIVEFLRYKYLTER